MDYKILQIKSPSVQNSFVQPHTFKTVVFNSGQCEYQVTAGVRQENGSYSNRNASGILRQQN